MGAPGDSKRHYEVVTAALDLLETASQGGSIVELEPPYRPGI